MAKNFVQEGWQVDIVAPAAVTSGQLLVTGTMFGVVLTTAASGATTALKFGGVWDLPKVAATAMTLGAAVYWDGTNSNVTTTASGNTKIGVVVKAAASSDATVRVRLNASF